MAKEKYISLKEASEVSGYTADYVGQLIRSGKLPGKQVFSHVAWMTTEESLKEYMEKNKKGSSKNFVPLKNTFSSFTNPVQLYKGVLLAVIFVVALFVLVLIYITSVSIDRHIDRAYQQKLQSI